jgi:zinc transport system substrate-binding protein
MKYFSIYPAVALLLFITWECSASAKETEKPVVSVSILPLQFLSDRVSGGDFEVNVIVPPGSNMETYEPTPQQMRKLAHSTLYIQIGLIDFETALTDGFLSEVPTLEIVNLSSCGMDLIADDGEHAHHRDNQNKEYPHGIDPHLWLSPRIVRAMAAMICSEFCRIQPDSAQKYRQNKDTLIKTIDSVDSCIRRIFKDLNNKKFITYHPALAYYARDYGLEQFSVEEEGKEPSATHLKALVEMAKNNGLNTVFYQAQLNSAVVKALAIEANLKMQPIDPLAYAWDENLLHISRQLGESMAR